MKFILADSLDMIDPDYDFRADRMSQAKTPFWRDVFAHEMFDQAPYDGLLVSMATVGYGARRGRFSTPQAFRFLREGARKFLRLDAPKHRDLSIFGDCGAFSYHSEEIPPYRVDDVLSFYHDAGVDYGFSLDHLIFEHDSTLTGMDGGTSEARRRFDITLENARTFIAGAPDLGSNFTPIGVVQGWSPGSMAEAARQLVAMGYDYLALGGMAVQPTSEIKACLAAVREAAPDVRLHLLGFAKTDGLDDFASMGLSSFDSTSPILRAFKDAKANYFARSPDGGMEYYTAIRVPQALENKDLALLAKSGAVKQEALVAKEKVAMAALLAFDQGTLGIEPTLDAVEDYTRAGLPKGDPRLPGSKSAAGQRDRYRRTLEHKPWKGCPCSICKTLSIEVMIYRGRDRNKRRGYHNLTVFHDMTREASIKLTRDPQINDIVVVPACVADVAPAPSF